MVKFDKVKNAFDITNEGIVIVEANLSGIMNYPGFAEAYPKAHDLYVKTCMFNYKNRVGTFMAVEDGDKKVIIIFTSYGRKEPKEQVIEAFKAGLYKVFNILPSDVFIYSPILGRRSLMFSEYINTIKSISSLIKGEAPRHWVVCTKGER